MEELAFRLLMIMRNPMYDNVSTSFVLERTEILVLEWKS